MNKIVISIEEAIMLEAYKTMRELHKSKNIPQKEREIKINKVFFNSNEALDKLGV